ncbi:MAG: tetratricopeptide repeat protein [Cyanobacteria bacterium]|nr:tetratricopeptide repeat protein [Cyanobacteriota bacterium]
MSGRPSVEQSDLPFRVLEGIGKFAATQHDYKTAEKYFHHCLLSAKEDFGVDDLRVALVLLDSADMHMMKNDYAQARRELHKARKVLQHCLSLPAH